MYLSDIVASGVLTPPVHLHRKYKGIDLKCVVGDDGKVTFDGHVYETPSTAAEAARKSVTGKRMNTNGWDFWLYESTDGWAKLDVARQLYLSRKT